MLRHTDTSAAAVNNFAAILIEQGRSREEALDALCAVLSKGDYWVMPHARRNAIFRRADRVERRARRRA